MSAIEELFKDEHYCYSELRKAREVFSSIESTDAQLDAVDKTLALCLLYCPEDIKDIVEATLLESTMRRCYRMTYLHKARSNDECTGSLPALQEQGDTGLH